MVISDLILLFIFSATFAPYSSVNYRYTEKVRSLFGNQEHVTNYKQFWKFIEEDLIEGSVLTHVILSIKLLQKLQSRQSQWSLSNCQSC